MTRMRAWIRLKLGWIPRPVRRVIVGVIGGTLLLLAVAGMILPIMPGVIFLPLGLAILAVEFAWAARWLKKVRQTAQSVRNRMRGATATQKPEEAGDSPADGAGTARPLPPPPPPPVSVASPTSMRRTRPNAAA
ncbi:MAG TPA: PGPGW domain-containing protein [Phycisphaerales bacterium]|nr:PGPGW domain-containing protein [Phycisphaerales bacterium]